MKQKNKKIREADRLANEIGLWRKNNLVFIRKSKIRLWKVLAILAFITGSVTSILWLIHMRMQQESSAFVKSPLMSIIKTRGCVADGILSGYGGDTDNLIQIINRSQCQYLHRSIETWAAPPDFGQVSANMAKINKKGVVYGMFLAEAINPNASYSDGKRSFNFSKMCRSGSIGFWGENTCKASLESVEYRSYLRSISQKAIDLGVQSFLFGQIYFQDNDQNPSTISGILDDMRNYAIAQGKSIVIGAQTNDITNAKYLQLFDYIEGGVGINPRGEIEDGPCFSRWWKHEGDRCWALLWHKNFSSTANDVLLHLDWSGLSWDDMSTFAQMDKKTRIKTLDNLYTSFTSKNMGFMMPYLAVISENINGCSGPQKNFYSPGNIYSCQDEDEINGILRRRAILSESVSVSGNTAPVAVGNTVPVKGGTQPTTSASIAGRDDAQFLRQVIPSAMTAGYRYQISITMRNIGENLWSKEAGYSLEATGSSAGFIPIKADMENDDFIVPGQSKTFTFDIFAPKISGKYVISWIMANINGTFGSPSDNVEILVTPEK